MQDVDDGKVGCHAAAIARRLRRGPRVLDTSDLAALAGRSAPGADVVAALCRDRHLLDMGGGLWLNGTLSPGVGHAEAAHRMRPGAVVSLLTVLGDTGVLHNPTYRAYAVFPGEDVTGEVDIRCATGPGHKADMLFHPMPRAVLEGPAAADMFDARRHIYPYPRATPEAALMHWLWLSLSHPVLRRVATITPPPLHDVEFEDLDHPRMVRIADAMGIRAPFQAMMARRPPGKHDDASYAPGSPP